MAKKDQKKARRAIALGDTALRVVKDVEAIQVMPGFSVTVNGLLVDGHPDFAACERMGKVLPTFEKASQFAVGDYLLYIEDALGERAAQIVDAENGWSLKTCENYKWLAARVAMDVRRMDRLGIRHHQLVAKLGPQQQVKWLTKAAADDEAQPWTVKRLKDAMAAGEDLPITGYWVLVLANDLADQEALMASLETQGRTCKATVRRGRKKDEPKAELAGAPA